MQKSLRPPAVPLVTIDPYFSVWSMADRLTDDFTRHWTGKRNAMTGLIRIDNVTWRFAGLVEPNPENYYTEPQAMSQKQFELSPLTTTYVYEQSGVVLTVKFTSPLLVDDLNLLSRPVSYVSLSVRSVDGKPHQVQVYFDVTGEWCVDTSDQKVVWQREQKGDLSLLKMSNEEQRHLNRSGDDVRIDWGDFYLAASSPLIRAGIGPASIRKEFVRHGMFKEDAKWSMPQTVRESMPVMACVWEPETVESEEQSELLVLAYDDVYAIEYFGEPLQAFWKSSGVSTHRMIEDAFAEYPDILERCEAFDRQLTEEATRAGGEKYAELLTLSYRQAIAAHKLVLDRDGKLLFLSKECYSNGCIATVDVSYPSIPLFLLYNPELVKAIMRPIFKYAASDAWIYPFAPHDVGQYPLANGQVYGENRLEEQMPIEECGNMLIMTAAVSLADGHTEFAEENRELLALWASYLMDNGLDPAEQLCTDDFAGHQARNANLSIKAIMGIAGYAIVLDLMGHAKEAESFWSSAKTMAVEWERLAQDENRYQLAFGSTGTWSLKYNLVWDVLWQTHIFSEGIAEQEVAWYLSKSGTYGVPLDSRATYTKSDWLVWAAAMASRREDFIRLIEPLWDFANETPDRVPFSDWYDTGSARQLNFQHRSVVGGLFIKLLKERGFPGAQILQL
ncbi:hypothetical protein GCM10010911_51450 [Paenibacillus nasutitermitis]|uniref:DUF4965 domain-containing protein n=2 Tax=Paenibacillus nasutitermitis TaxID=1652958 RepID=A0A917DZ92_9BACL|nr:glutaminase family protein [Paenibacillus nasutitermitis]GGD86688.1 hypothetical protein GCM10010911_51450 [Paenibacillus nasutitermitis]